MTLRTGYACLFWLGVFLPLASYLGFSWWRGPDPLDVSADILRSGVVAHLAINGLVAAAAAIAFIATDGPKRRIPYCGWAILLTLVPGVSAGLPFYLWLREKYRVHGRMRSA